MAVVTGRFAEARVYFYYVVAMFRPGVEVPTFAAPAEFNGKLEGLEDDDLKLIVEEGRRQLDRQLNDLERIRGRASSMLAIAVGELAVLSASAHRAFASGTTITIVWVASFALAILAIGGAASVATSQARLGRTDTQHLAHGAHPVLPSLAAAYAWAVGDGEETVRTRLTVMRDAVYLAVLAALLLAIVWPFTVSPEATGKQPPSTPTGGSTCATTCTPPSPNPSLSTGPTRTSSPSPLPTTGPAPAPSTPHP